MPYIHVGCAGACVAGTPEPCGQGTTCVNGQCQACTPAVACPVANGCSTDSCNNNCGSCPADTYCSSSVARTPGTCDACSPSVNTQICKDVCGSTTYTTAQYDCTTTTNTTQPGCPGYPISTYSAVFDANCPHIIPCPNGNFYACNDGMGYVSCTINGAPGYCTGSACTST